ncbi:GntR family transcriptional regulator [SAR92 clade bacterium H455]|uniref:GntR family transcriptional regulator n=1 Tax=SAR92 clade bacterium H455 TaxID=2974818 RepID=A0ABY5TPN2_9GAMM|nr:GntR family transcriptional regulator [SAR92 clade bacterium H455]
MLSEPDGVNKTVFLAVLFVLIGCCIDIGKYLFWAQRQRSPYFVGLSLTLMTFSWLASCAFFMSSEASLLQEAQTNTGEYVALQHRIEGLTQEISHHERLLDNRLNSSYHKQWEAGEGDANTIAKLRVSLNVLIERLPSAGRENAAEQVPTAQFFKQVGEAMNVSVDTARIIGYGVLSLLLEVSTLGMISLVQVFRADMKAGGRANSDGKGAFIHNSDQLNLAAQQAVIQLICDILSGQVPPVFRKLRAAEYGVDHSVIQQVLKNLHAIGLLEDGKRNSYKLREGLKLNDMHEEKTQ